MTGVAASRHYVTMKRLEFNEWQGEEERDMRKMLFVVGSAGAGKTTIAEALARKSRAAFFDMDTMLRPAAEAIMKAAGYDPSDRDSPDYKALCRDLGYRITMDAALENVRLGNDAVVVGPFTKETSDAGWLGRELASAGLSAGDVLVKAIYVYLDDAQRYRERIEGRDLRSDDWKLQHWNEFSRSLARRKIAWPLPESSVLYWDNSPPLTEERAELLERFLNG